MVTRRNIFCAHSGSLLIEIIDGLSILRKHMQMVKVPTSLALIAHMAEKVLTGTEVRETRFAKICVSALLERFRIPWLFQQCVPNLEGSYVEYSHRVQ